MKRIISILCLLNNIYSSAQSFHNNHEYVDLGLPSGTKWATVNIGAEIPEQLGNLYSWGEVEPKSDYSLSSYKCGIYHSEYVDKDGFTMPAYYESTIGRELSGTENDAAHVNWGGDWEMPSVNQVKELVNNCTFKYVEINGVTGFKVIGANGNSIFLPGNELWTGSASNTYGNTYSFEFKKVFDDFNQIGEYNWVNFENRAVGRPIRPVCRSGTVKKTLVTEFSFQISEKILEIGDCCEASIWLQPYEATNQTIRWTSSDDRIAEVSRDGVIKALSGGNVTITGATCDGSNIIASCEITVVPSITHIDEIAVDLGLPTGTKWASHNIGANSPEEIGNLYAWGETETKESYNLSNYTGGRYHEGEKDRHGYTLDPYYESLVGTDICGTEFDAAHVNWGGEWSMPNVEQTNELIANCLFKYARLNGVEGFKVIGKNGNYIFLPGNDVWIGIAEYEYGGTYTFHYSHVFDHFNSREAYEWYNFEYRANGIPIRPIIPGKKESSASIGISNIYISEDRLFLYVGESGKNKVIIFPTDATNKKLKWISEDESIAKVSESGMVEGVSVGETKIKVSTLDGNIQRNFTVYVIPETHCDDLAVDLGLPSGTKWASHNLGTQTADEIGILFAWGETSPKDEYTLENYIHKTYKVGDVDAEGYEIPAHYESTIGMSINGTEYDAAKAIWGDEWQIPTAEQFWELLNYCMFKYVYLNGQGGFKITGRNGNHIFIRDTDVWTATAESNLGETYSFNMTRVNDTSYDIGPYIWHDFVHRATGRPIRPVSPPPHVPVSSLDLNCKSGTIEVGNYINLEVTINPSNATDKNVIWSTSDEEVASVTQNGLVTGKKTGVAIITVKSVDDSTVLSTCTVTVTPILVKEIIVLKPKVSLFVGETITVEASVRPENAANDSLTWHSSDTNIATVNNGAITGISVGTATITVESTDGSGKSASCAVTVNPILVESITLDKTTVALQEGETTTLVASILPSNVTNDSLIWRTSDERIATVHNGVVTAKKVGTATITVESTDGSGKSASCAVTVNPVKVESITLDKTTVALQEGETATLIASILPNNVTNDSLIWWTSDEQIATVHNGVVTAKKVGTATITAESTDGSGKSASCTAIITEAPRYSITFILDSLVYAAYELKYGDKIDAPIVQENDYYSFSGWKDLPEYMPANDLIIYGERKFMKDPVEEGEVITDESLEEVRIVFPVSISAINESATAFICLQEDYKKFGTNAQRIASSADNDAWVVDGRSITIPFIWNSTRASANVNVDLENNEYVIVLESASIDFEDGTTNVEISETVKTAINNTVTGIPTIFIKNKTATTIDLLGRKVEQVTNSSILILNGKKVIIK